MLRTDPHHFLCSFYFQLHLVFFRKEYHTCDEALPKYQDGLAVVAIYLEVSLIKILIRCRSSLNFANARNIIYLIYLIISQYFLHFWRHASCCLSAACDNIRFLQLLFHWGQERSRLRAVVILLCDTEARDPDFTISERQSIAVVIFTSRTHSSQSRREAINGNTFALTG